MKPSHNLSFSCEQNRVDYHYIPENCVSSNSIIDGLNITQLYERSLSSSFLALPQLQPFSLNSSFSLQCEDPLLLRKKESSRHSDVKIQNTITKVQFNDHSSIMDLGLECLVSGKKMSTKNVLRNFGNAQAQYILHNPKAQDMLEQILPNKKQFQQWVRKQKLLNFEDYKKVWTATELDENQQKLFKRVYKKLCWDFYEEQCIPYIFGSRLTPDNKKSHLLQIYKMLKGIQNANSFEGFKQ